MGTDRAGKSCLFFSPCNVGHHILLAFFFFVIVCDLLNRKEEEEEGRTLLLSPTAFSRWAGGLTTMAVAGETDGRRRTNNKPTLA